MRTISIFIIDNYPRLEESAILSLTSGTCSLFCPSFSISSEHDPERTASIHVVKGSISQHQAGDFFNETYVHIYRGYRIYQNLVRFAPLHFYSQQLSCDQPQSVQLASANLVFFAVESSCAPNNVNFDTSGCRSNADWDVDWCFTNCTLH